jgi:translocation and assembly module TamB
VEGQVAWAPQLDWDAKATLKDFDPGYFVPGWNGRLSGNLASKGRQLPPPANAPPGTAGTLEATVDLPSLKASCASATSTHRASSRCRARRARVT